MLKDKDNLLITEEEVNLICSINADNETGRHLITNRSEEYWNMRVAIEEARLHCRIGNATEKEKQIVEYQKQASDYDYWKSLPDEEKLFVETEDEEDLYRTCERYWLDFPLPLDRYVPHCEIVDRMPKFKKMEDAVPYPCLKCPFDSYSKKETEV